MNMPIAAVPAYLGKDFSTASPGLRFGFYLPIWTCSEDREKENEDRKAELWDKNDDAANKAWRAISKLTVNDQKTLKGLQERQIALYAQQKDEQAAMFVAESIAPFTTGLGNAHPLENGFAFLWPYGLPYLPGSGVKGVLRQAARELAAGRWGDTHGWSNEAITALFGNDEDGSTAKRGALGFWDVIPTIKGNALQVEVMTPHQPDYYQGKEAPHDSGTPKPIFFLAIPPGSKFNFYVVCNENLLTHSSPVLADGGRWRELLQAVFEHAFDWLGFGAKTSVGYGAMRADEVRLEEQRQQIEEKKARQQREAELAALPPLEREITEIMESDHDPGMALFNKLKDGQWTDAADCRCVAGKIRALWQQEKKWNPGFTGTNKQKRKQKERCERVEHYLQQE